MSIMDARFGYTQIYLYTVRIDRNCARHRQGGGWVGRERGSEGKREGGGRERERERVGCE